MLDFSIVCKTRLLNVQNIQKWIIYVDHVRKQKHVLSITKQEQLERGFYF